MERSRKGAAQGILRRLAMVGVLVFAMLVIVVSATNARSPAGAPAPVPSTDARLDPYEPIPPDVGTDAELREWGTARSDHLSLALMILNRCFRETNNPMKWSTQIKAMLLFGLNGHLVHSPVPTGASDNDGRLTLNNWFQGAALSYSDRLSRDRLYYQRIFYENQYRAEHYQVAIAIVAALATVLIGIKAIWPNSPGVSWQLFGILFGVLALGASSAVTALTTLNSFYGSQDEATRDQRTIGQLKQLHWRIINDAEADRNLCLDEKPPVQSTEARVPGSPLGNDEAAAKIYSDQANKVASWKQRHEQILNDALPTLAKTGDLARPGDSNGPGGPTRPDDQPRLNDQTQAGQRPRPPGA